MKIGIACRYQHLGEKQRSVVHSETLSNLLKTIRPGSDTPASGDGTLETPYVLTHLNQWFWMALQEPLHDPTFVRVGGQLIAKWGQGGGQYVNYCTDVTDFVDIVTAKCIGQSDYEDAIRSDIGKWYKTYDSLSGQDSDLPSYTRKALRVHELDDRVAAHVCRNLIEDVGDCGDYPELAGTLCSLLIGEGHRSPETFVVSLMLLDLIETGTTYGSGGLKTYTWKSMLMYGLDGLHISGRGLGLKSMAKHPMVGTGTVAQSGRIHSFDGRTNDVKDQIISVTAAWLAHYMTKMHEGFTFFIVGGGAHAPWTEARQGKTSGGDEGLRKNCSRAIRDRCASSGILIGGTTVLYEDLLGNSI